MKDVMKLLMVAAVLCGLVVFGALKAWATTNLSADLQVRSDTYTLRTTLSDAGVYTSTITDFVNVLQDAGPSAGVAIDRGGAVASVVAAEVDGGIAGGNMRCYVWMPVSESNGKGWGTGVPGAVTYAWFPYSSLDWAPATGGRYAASGDKQALTGIGRITWLPDAVTTTISLTDAGTTSGTQIIETLSVRKGMPK